MSTDGAVAFRHRVVVVGGGFGGLFAARRLRSTPVHATLVDRSANHVFQLIDADGAQITLPYDSLIVAVGFRTSYSGTTSSPPTRPE